MTIKLKAPRAWLYPEDVVAVQQHDKNTLEIPFRLVREADWRKLMKLVRACEVQEETAFRSGKLLMLEALDALKGAK